MGTGFDDFTDVPYAIDFGNLTWLIESVTYIGSYLLGLVAIFIILFMAFITVMDILYLSFPTFQGFIRSRGWDGAQQSSNFKFKLISKDAYNVAEEAAASLGQGRYKSQMLMYIVKRCDTYFKAGIVVAILLIGSSPFVELISSWIEPLLEVFGWK